MKSRHCGQDKRIFLCPVHNPSTPCSLQAFGIRYICLVMVIPGRGGGGCAAGFAKVLPFARPNFANFVTLYQT